MFVNEKNNIKLNMIHKDFINPNFLLDNDTAYDLYYRFAENKPVIDFSCMLTPDIFSNDPLLNAYDLWIKDDTDKSRLINSFNKNTQSNHSDDKKLKAFINWAQAIEKSAGSNKYQLAHLELALFFNIQELLSAKSAKTIYDTINDKLSNDKFTTFSLLHKLNVEKLYINTDPFILDKFEFESSKIIPSFNISRLIDMDDIQDYKKYLKSVEENLNVEVNNFNQLLDIIESRHSYLHSKGCTTMYLEIFNGKNNSFVNLESPDSIFQKIRTNKQISSNEINSFRMHLISFIVDLNYKKQWIQVINVKNNNNKYITDLLLEKEQKESLPSTLVNIELSQDNFSSNTTANSLCSYYLGENIHYKCIHEILNQFSNGNYISNICGFSSGAKNLLSLSKHEYFRRLICNYIGGQVEKGFVPDDEELLKMLIESIIYNNIKSYFNF